VPFVEGPRRVGDPPMLIADPQLGKSLLDWHPFKSDLHTMVQTAWNWHEGRALKTAFRHQAGDSKDFESVELIDTASERSPVL